METANVWHFERTEPLTKYFQNEIKTSWFVYVVIRYLRIDFIFPNAFVIKTFLVGGYTLLMSNNWYICWSFSSNFPNINRLPKETLVIVLTYRCGLNFCLDFSRPRKRNTPAYDILALLSFTGDCLPFLMQLAATVVDCMAWRFWTMRQSNRMATQHLPRDLVRPSSGLNSWLKRRRRQRELLN